MISLNVLMMPVTVPSSPSSGADAAQIAMNGRNRFTRSFVVRTVSYMTSSISSRGSRRCSTPACSILPLGPRSSDARASRGVFVAVGDRAEQCVDALARRPADERQRRST